MSENFPGGHPIAVRSPATKEIEDVLKRVDSMENAELDELRNLRHPGASPILAKIRR